MKANPAGAKMTEQQYIISKDKRQAIRDHAARDKDAARNRLADDLAAYLARGGRVDEAVPMMTAPGRAPARARGSETYYA